MQQEKSLLKFHTIVFDPYHFMHFRQHFFINEILCRPVVFLIIEVHWVEPFHQTVIKTEFHIRVVSDSLGQIT